MKTRLPGAVLVLVAVLGMSRAAYGGQGYVGQHGGQEYVGQHGGQEYVGQHGGQEYIVTLRAGQAISDVHQKHNTKTVAQIPNKSIYLITGGPVGGSVLQDLQNDPQVESAEENVQIKLGSNQQAALDSGLANVLPSLLNGETITTFYGTNVLNSYADQPALVLSHVNDTRYISTGAGTRVAYIDTGVDPYHPALSPWLDPGVDLLNNRSASELDGLSDSLTSLLDDSLTSLLDNRFFFLLDDVMVSTLNGYWSGAVFPPEFGHGTLVAGMIHVVAPNARIVPIKAFDLYGYTTMFRIIQGVHSAEDLGVDVLNMSFSTTEYSATLRKAITDAWSSGIAIVAAVGNDGREVSGVYPASYPHVIGVAATDFQDHIASFSNYGTAVSVDATGAFVVSTAPGGRYAAAWGTSFSAPIVSGAIAMIASLRGHGHADSRSIVHTADNIDSLNPGFAGQLGKGRVNLLRALKNWY